MQPSTILRGPAIAGNPPSEEECARPLPEVPSDPAAAGDGPQMSIIPMVIYSEAREITNRMKDAAENICMLVRKAHEGRRGPFCNIRRGKLTSGASSI